MRIPETPLRRRIARRCLVLFPFLLLLVTGATLAVVWPPPAAAPTAAAPIDAPQPATATVAAGEPSLDEPPLERTAAAPPCDIPLPTFEQLIERLVVLGRQTAERAQLDDLEAAAAADRDARAVLAALLQRFHDAGERSLAVLASLGTPPGADEATGADASDPARRIVLEVVLAADLARRHELALAVQDRCRIDPLVESLLLLMPQCEGTTEVGARLLGDRPYLQAAHERAVLALLQLAGEGSFPRPVATQLLATLWDNLQRTGERSSADLSRLAMLLLAEDEVAERVVACRQLIADPRFRLMALAWLREHGDFTVASDIAGLVTREMEPDVAWSVLRELAPILPRATGPYMVLGSRSPELVADAYRELLATNTQPGVRADLVAGVGFTGSHQARSVAELALHDDPAPEVRLQAGFVLTASGDAEVGERALQHLLDDRAIAGDPARLGAVVLALHNLEAGGATNAIDRLGQRLRRLPLSEASRQQLEALLARSLPGGVSSATADAANGGTR